MADEIPKRDRPLSTVYYEIGKRWVELDAAARALEDTKSSILSQKKMEMELVHGKITKAQAEDLVKADPKWLEFIQRIVDARTAANYEKIKLDTIRMRHAEQQSKEATARHEARLDR